MARSKTKEVSAALFRRIKPLLLMVQPFPKLGRPRLDDELPLNGILFVMRMGIPWEELPQEPGFGSGMTGWTRLRDWQASGVWHRLHQVLLAELRSAGQLDLSSASLGATIAATPRAARIQAPTPRTEANSVVSATSSRIARASR